MRREQALAEIEGALSAASSPRQACVAVLDHLADGTGLMPSAYLALGDRLRLMGARGYWQAYDGMSRTSGVIGRTWHTGVEQLLEDVDGHDDYLAASASVAAEICLPLRAHGSVVGVLNVEAMRPFTAAEVDEVRRCAEALCARLGELPQPQESTAQWMSRQVVDLVARAARHDRVGVERRLVELAVELSGLETAVLVRSSGGDLTAVAGTGTLAPRLTSLAAADYRDMAQWVAGGATIYSLGVTGGVGFPGHERLRGAGAETIVAVPLSLGVDDVGFVLLADVTVHRVDTYAVALLEVLAAQASSCLQVCDAMSGLRERAERDALTSLGHHAAFQQALPEHRRSRERGALAVMYLDVDRFKQVNDSLGHAAGDALLVGVATALREALRGADQVFRIGGDEFAALARVTDAEDALALGRRLAAAAWRDTGVSLSVGVAIAGDDEPDQAVLARADAALYQVKLAGRGDVRLLTA